MLIEYIHKAMSKAIYDKLEDGSFSGKIPYCPGACFWKNVVSMPARIKSLLRGVANCKNPTW